VNNKKATVIIQARTQSTRLPNKVLALINHKPLIWYIIERLKSCERVEQIILATSNREEDKKLIEIANDCKILSFVGDENDVLSRFYQATLKFNADPIVRVTGDCPLVDPDLLDKMLGFYLENNYDFVSNTIIPTYPDGLDIEIFSFKSLRKTFNEAKLKSEKEHVTPYIWKNPGIFQLYNYRNKEELSNYRWTVDEQLDLELIRQIYSNFKPKIIFSFQDVIEMGKLNPQIFKINEKINRNEGYLKSIKEDDKK
jgi:spore coat polysaccharide biosynthesis protein SpsF (cytidylyltransferase family)|tara:strand:- start:841 stop:1605 length:765 start_codon:yes stop_codon:yes gene_type:complete